MAILSDNIYEQDEEEDIEELDDVELTQQEMHLQKMAEIQMEVDEMHADTKLLNKNTAQLNIFRDTMIEFMPKIIAQLDKYSPKSEHHNEEKFSTALTCQEFVEVVKERLFSCVHEMNMGLPSVLEFCEDLSSYQCTMEILMKTLD